MNIREAIDKIVNRINLSEAETDRGDEPDHDRRGDAVAGGVLSHRAANERRNRRRNYRSGAGDARKGASGQRRRQNRVGYLRHRRGSEGDIQYLDDMRPSLSPAPVFRRQAWQPFGFEPIGQRRRAWALWASRVDAPKERVEQCIAKIGIGFLFAPLLHEAMKYAVQPRRDIGIRTIFNLLGPLTNPAMATHQLIGIYSGELVAVIAHVLKNLGSARAHGRARFGRAWTKSLFAVRQKSPSCAMDRSKSILIEPEQLGFKRCRLEELHGGSAEESAVIVTACSTVKGRARDVVLLNSGAALYVSGKAATIRTASGSRPSPSIREGARKNSSSWSR